MFERKVNNFESNLKIIEYSIEYYLITLVIFILKLFFFLLQNKILFNVLNWHLNEI